MTTDQRSDQSGILTLFAGIGVGVLIGGAVALLLAPQSGQQTRAQLRESAEDALDRLRESMDDLRAKVDELAAQKRESSAHAAMAAGALQGDVAGATDDTALGVG